MKKRKKNEPKIPEIVSLNEELFSLQAGSLPFEELLDRRLELAVAAIGGTNFVCDTFTCGTFNSCRVFGCGTFKVSD